MNIARMTRGRWLPALTLTLALALLAPLAGQAAPGGGKGGGGGDDGGVPPGTIYYEHHPVLSADTKNSMLGDGSGQTHRRIGLDAGEREPPAPRRQAVVPL